MKEQLAFHVIGDVVILVLGPVDGIGDRTLLVDRYEKIIHSLGIALFIGQTPVLVIVDPVVSSEHS